MTREAKPLNHRVSQRLLTYVTIAGAAVAASASHADAEVVYTPLHRNVQFSYDLDLNNDGIPDFQLTSTYLSGYGNVDVKPVTFGNRAVASPRKCGFVPSAAAALHSGAVIGPGLPFMGDANCMVFLDYFREYGPWLHAGVRYLGLVFVVDGASHFGWARLRVNSSFCGGCGAAILGYAYETVPNKPIIAGDEGSAASASRDPGTLGFLALGSLQF
jgi:hypothetical protein